MKLLLDTHVFLWFLSGDSQDPFDRVLIAQAISEDIHLVSKDTLFKNYKVKLLWD